VKEDELIGKLHLSKEIRPFNDKQIALVRTLTKQAAIAIENSDCQGIGTATTISANPCSCRLRRRRAESHQPSAFDLQAVFQYSGLLRSSSAAA